MKFVSTDEIYSVYAGDRINTCQYLSLPFSVSYPFYILKIISVHAKGDPRSQLGAIGCVIKMENEF